MTYLTQNTAGKGIGFANISSLYINQSGATTAIGETLALAEAVGEGSANLVMNSHADNGTLAQVVLPPASAGVTGAAPPGPSGSLIHHLLTTEVSAVGSPVRCIVEGYYVDALVTGTSIPPRGALFYDVTGGRDLETPGESLGLPVVARYLQATGSPAGILQKVHFRGLPGGFGIGAGAA